MTAYGWREPNREEGERKREMIKGGRLEDGRRQHSGKKVGRKGGD